MLEIVGTRLGRRAVAAAIRVWHTKVQAMLWCSMLLVTSRGVARHTLPVDFGPRAVQPNSPRARTQAMQNLLQNRWLLFDSGDVFVGFFIRVAVPILHGFLLAFSYASLFQSSMDFLMPGVFMLSAISSALKPAT
jgi:hypothetical protein